MCAACAPISYHGVWSHLWAQFSHSQWEGGKYAGVQCRVPTFSKKPNLRSFLVSLLRQRWQSPAQESITSPDVHSPDVPAEGATTAVRSTWAQWGSCALGASHLHTQAGVSVSPEGRWESWKMLERITGHPSSLWLPGPGRRLCYSSPHRQLPSLTTISPNQGSSMTLPVPGLAIPPVN